MLHSKEEFRKEILFDLRKVENTPIFTIESECSYLVLKLSDAFHAKYLDWDEYSALLDWVHGMIYFSYWTTQGERDRAKVHQWVWNVSFKY